MIVKDDAIRVVVLGAGEHAKMIADAILNSGLKSKGFDLVGFLNDNPALLNQCILDRPVLGSIDDLKNVPHDAVVVGIGENESWCRLFELLTSRGEKFTTIIHSSAVIASDVKIGVGTVVLASVVINTGADIKNNVILNTSCTMDHDCVVGSHSHICPGAHLGGNVCVGEGSWIGISSTVFHKISIGGWATVINDVLANTTVVDVPAKELPLQRSKQRFNRNFYINTQSTSQSAYPSVHASSEIIS